MMTLFELVLVSFRWPDLHPRLALHPRADESVQILRVNHERPHVPGGLRAGIQQRTHEPHR